MVIHVAFRNQKKGQKGSNCMSWTPTTNYSYPRDQKFHMVRVLFCSLNFLQCWKMKRWMRPPGWNLGLGPLTKIRPWSIGVSGSCASCVVLRMGHTLWVGHTALRCDSVCCHFRSVCRVVPDSFSRTNTTQHHSLCSQCTSMYGRDQQLDHTYSFSCSFQKQICMLFISRLRVLRVWFNHTGNQTILPLDNLNRISCEGGSWKCVFWIRENHSNSSMTLCLLDL